MIRKPYRAGSFYPSSAGECRKLIAVCAGQWNNKEFPGARAGIVPHAGWVYSGPTAATVYLSLKKYDPETIIIFGAVHVPGVRKAALFTGQGWGTPLGTVETDEIITAEILREAGRSVTDNTDAHIYEHSIEVQLPFIRHFFPECRVAAMMVPPDSNAHLLGKAVGNVVKRCPGRISIIGSTDLTHYGAMNFGFAPKGGGPEALAWVKESNDRRMIDKILALEEGLIVQEAHEHYNACGAGAIAATVAAVKVLGLEKGQLLHYTTSYDVMPERKATDFVGYAAITF